MTAELIIQNEAGAIEDVYGTGVSFNVYRRLEVNRIRHGTLRFYKSAYKLETAKKYLQELN